ncbi:MAG: hypothetical protein ABSB35_41785 [Bryobacteraceae bacterium]
MNKIGRLIACALFLILTLWAPASSLAQSPFNGTWRINMDQTKMSPKPVVFSVNHGMYDCFHCNPQIHVRADGQDQSVNGQSFDTISVREVDPRSIVSTTKKSGKTMTERAYTVSDDGNTLTVKIMSHQENGGQPVSEEVTLTRVGKAPAGANGTSGSWRINKVKGSENDLITTYKTSGDELSMSAPTGQSYTAKLDGEDHLVKGEYGYNSVSLRLVNDRRIEETHKLDGKVVEVVKMTVSPDGKRMTIVVSGKLTSGMSTFVAEKQ